jgi:hypothetical protein
VQTRHGHFILRLAETKFYAAFVRLNGVDGLNADKGKNHENKDGHDATIEAARQHALETILTATDDFFQIGRAAIAVTAASATAAWPVWPLSPRSTLVVSSAAATITAAAAPRATAAILIAPGHSYLFVIKTFPLPLQRAFAMPAGISSSL